MHPARPKARHCRRRWKGEAGQGARIFCALLICTYKVQKLKVTFYLKVVTIGYYIVICILFNETYYWLLLVTTLWSVHIRSGKRKQLLMKHTTGYFWLLIVTTKGEAGQGARIFCALLICTYKVQKLKVTFYLKVVTIGYYIVICILFNETYYWLLLVTTLWSVHIRSGKRKPLLMKHTTGYFWLLMVTTLRSAHIRSGKHKQYIKICTYKVWKTEATF